MKGLKMKKAYPSNDAYAQFNKVATPINENPKNYALSRLREIKDYKIGYTERPSGLGHSLFGAASGYGDPYHTAKMTLINEGKFTINKDAAINGDQDSISSNDVIDIFFAFDQDLLKATKNRIDSEQEEHDKTYQGFVGMIWSIYTNLQDKFILTKVSKEDMYQYLRDFESVEMHNFNDFTCLLQ